MGFFDGLTSTWKGLFSNFGKDTSQAWDGLKSSGSGLYHGFLTAAGAALHGAFSGAFAPSNVGQSLGDPSQDPRYQLGQGMGQILGGVGKGLGSIGSFPVLKQVGETDLWATKQLLNRPLATAGLQFADAINGQPGNLFSGDAWRNAYDASRSVTAGQANVFATMSLASKLGFLPPRDDQPAWLKTAEKWTHTEGFMAPYNQQGTSAWDPRTPEGQSLYHTNPWFQTASGAGDAGLMVVLDPLKGVDKLTKFSKMKLITRPISSASAVKLAGDSSKWQAYTNSSNYEKLYDFISKAKSPEEVRRTVFNDHYQGGVMANALWSVADDKDLYNTTFRTMYGDPNAWDELVQQAPRLAQVTGTKFANYSISQVAKNMGLGDEFADQAAKNKLETDVQAFADAIADGRGFWGQIKPKDNPKGAPGGILVNQAQPRLRFTSKYRAGSNQLFQYGPNTILGRWLTDGSSGAYTARTMTRTLLPSARGGRMLDLNNPDSLRIFTNNLQQSRLDPGQVDNFASMYARASTPESRFMVVNQAENAAFRAHAVAHGVSAEHVDDLINSGYLNQFRSGNRAFIRANKRFFSSDVRRQANDAITKGNDKVAAGLTSVADELDQSVEEGRWPRSFVPIPDEDGNLNLIPLDSTADASRPILESQYADAMPMQDWGALDSALWWEGKGALGRGIWKTKEAATTLAETAASLWKITAIMRPGYIWRTLSDEAGGPIAVMGGAPIMGAATEGVKNAWHNMYNRAQLVPAYVKRIQAGGKASRLVSGARGTNVPGAVVDEAVNSEDRLSHKGNDPDYTAYTFGANKQGYTSFDKALASGTLGVQDFMTFLLAHGDEGQLPHDYQTIYEGLKSGSLTKAQAQDYAVDHALANAGMDAYNSPAWQQSVIQAAIDARKDKAQGIPGQPIVIDPRTGTSPQVQPQRVNHLFSLGDAHVIPADPTKFEEVGKFIHANMDDLLKPSNLLHAYVRPDGNLSMSVARYTGGSELAAVKPGSGRRVKLGKVEGKTYRGAGETGYDIPYGPNPEDVVHIRGAFEGPQGDLFKSQVSSRGPYATLTDRITNSQHARLMANTPGEWVNLGPDDGGYDASWERAVNQQLANDALARQFLANPTRNGKDGFSVQDAVAWMHNTNEGRSYQARMGAWQSRYYDQIHHVQAMVDQYVPFNENAVEASDALRAAVLKREASIGHLSKVVTRDDMPQIHGASLQAATGMGWFNAKAREITDKTFGVISDMPNDNLLRFPFTSNRYQFHVNNLVKSRAEWLKAKGDVFTQADIDGIEKLARERTLVDARRYLYDTMASHDLAKGLRLLIPFGSALMDSANKWGVVLREHPSMAADIWRLWSYPDRNGLIQDQDGNQLQIEDGKEVWYQVNPKTGERTKLPDTFKPNGKVITFRLPVGVKIDGMKPVVAINKQAFQTFLDIPTFGPAVTIPANEFAMSHPEFATNQLVKTFIMPYGATGNPLVAAVPGNLRNWGQQIQSWRGVDDQNAEEQAMAVYMTEMSNYAQGKRTNAPTFAEARSKAAQMQMLRFLARLGGVTSQIDSPYQPYIDYYHLLQQQDPGNADKNFYDQMGPEFFWLTSAVTRNALGIPATVGAFNQYKKLGDLMQQFPDLAPLISGAEGAGTFSKAVYEAQKRTPVRYGTQKNERELVPLQESVADTQKRLGWVEWTKFNDALTADLLDRGLTSLQQKGAEDLAQAKKDYLDNHMTWKDPYGTVQVSPWYQDYASQDDSKMTSRLTQMAQIVQDKRLQGRDDIQGLIDYLSARQGFQDYMTSVGVKSLNSPITLAPNTKKLSKPQQLEVNLTSQWNQYVMALKANNLSFANLYDRWLSADDKLTAQIAL